MKKAAVSILVLFLTAALLLTGCSSLSDAKDEIQAALDALAAADSDTFCSYLHPSLLEEDLESGLTSLMEIIDGRSTASIRFQNININNGIGEGGRYRQESGSCIVTLDDGTLLQLQYYWLSDSAGEGFSGFFLDNYSDETTQATAGAI